MLHCIFSDTETLFDVRSTEFSGSLYLKFILNRLDCTNYTHDLLKIHLCLIKIILIYTFFLLLKLYKISLVKNDSGNDIKTLFWTPPLLK